MLATAGRHAEAEPRLRDVRRMRRARLGHEAPAALAAADALATTLQELGRLEEAEDLLTEVGRSLREGEP